MKQNILLALLLATLSTTIYAGETLYDSLTHDGLTRYYYVYVPDVYDGSERVPLLFNLHGYTSNAPQQNFYGDFKPIADTANFIMCLPEGTFDLGGNQFWNAGFGGGVDDVGFINALINKLSGQYEIEGDRIYSTGMSNGGYMSYTLACELSDKITAIASVTGTMTSLQVSTCDPSRVVPVMQIHGTADATVPYNGSAGNLSMIDLIEFWRDHNNCATTADTTQIPDTNTSDGCTAERYDFQNCDAESELVFYRIEGGAHTWPGASITIDVTNQDFDASEVIWEFFSKYEHPTFTSINDEITLAQQIELVVNKNQLVVKQLPENHDEIQILNALGQTLITTPNTSIDISNLSGGVHFVVINSKSGVWVDSFWR